MKSALNAARRSGRAQESLAMETHSHERGVGSLTAMRLIGGASDAAGHESAPQLFDHPAIRPMARRRMISTPARAAGGLTAA